MTTELPFDSVLLLGFGGPTPGCCGRRGDACPKTPGCEAECFVAKILGDDPRQRARIDAVAEHYHHFGGFSPYNDLTERQRSALEAAFTAAGEEVTVAVGYRNWSPWYADGWVELMDKGCRRTALAVLAPHQGKRSWDDYIDEATAAHAEVPGAPDIVGTAGPLFAHSQFIDALLGRIAEQTEGWSDDRRQRAGLLLTAHAIPQPAERGAYRPQVEQTASLVAERAGFDTWHLGFQSAPDESRIPWSSPTVDDCLAEMADGGCDDIVCLPIGFLVDHMEVLYDLDTDLAGQATERGRPFHRAGTVGDHPDFIAALADSLRRLGAPA
jgi:ferrochelatase